MPQVRLRLVNGPCGHKGALKNQPLVESDLFLCPACGNRWIVKNPPRQSSHTFSIRFQFELRDRPSPPMAVVGAGRAFTTIMTWT